VNMLLTPCALLMINAPPMSTQSAQLVVFA
jgi:hypothetical protein